MSKSPDDWTPCHVGILWKHISPEEIVLTTHAGHPIFLTALGSEIFLKCNGGNTISSIVADLAERQESHAAADLERTACQFLRLLESMGILVVDWDPF